MKILVVNEKCGYFGGVEQNIADATQLRRAGHRCLLAWGTRTHTDAADYDALFDDAAPCAELGAADGDRFATLLQLWNPDTVYFHKVPRIKPLLESMGNRFAVRMVHDHDLCCPRGHKYFALNGHICGYAAGWRCLLDGAFVGRGPDGLQFVNVAQRLRELRDNYPILRILVASHFMKRELMQNGFDAERIAVLPPAVTAPPSSSLPPPVRGSGRVLYVGQLVRGKGVDLLLAALAGVSRDWALDVVGVGNALPALRRNVLQRQLKNRVRFHGWVPTQEMARLYSEADVVAVPSRWPEPFGMVGPQAMLAARPVVAFDVGGIREWLDDGETGLLVPPLEIASFRAAVQRLLDDVPLANRMGHRARNVALERFSSESYLSRLERLLTPQDFAGATWDRQRATRIV